MPAVTAGLGRLLRCRLGKDSAIRLPDLGHTAATLMHSSGRVHLRTLAAVLGHAGPAFTLRSYAHSSDEAMSAAASTLATLFEAQG
ncbi:MAG: hypothetical protein JWM76_2795 [Pseudonocardiales bacterium]|nr:hypothetical protein [Pseudonocardiales bacterium]